MLHQRRLCELVIHNLQRMILAELIIWSWKTLKTVKADQFLNTQLPVVHVQFTDSASFAHSKKAL